MKSLLGVASPAGQRARLSIFIFHRVFAEPDPVFPQEMHARQFDQVCGWLKSWFNVLPLDQAVSMLNTGSLPARAACITFDDGYADNHDVALPMLQRNGLPATFFVATGFLDGGRMWNDTVIESVRRSTLTTLDLGEIGCYSLSTSQDKGQAIDAIIRQIKYLPVSARSDVTERIASAARVCPPDDLMMTTVQVKAMRRANMQIGAHTISHPILANLSDAQAGHEIKGSKDFLENLLGERVGLFAYPNGKPGEDYSPQTVAVVRELGFDAAVSTYWGAALTGTDPLQIPRFTPWDHTQVRFALRLLDNFRRPSL